MADYTVTNAGSGAFNDDYTENGAFNSKPCYQGGVGGMWLYYAKPNPPATEGWVLDAVVDNRVRGTPDHLSVYGYWIVNAGATPPVATYAPGTGGAPGADVALYEAPPSGQPAGRRFGAVEAASQYKRRGVRCF